MIERNDPCITADEPGVLIAFLDYYRSTLLMKADGLDDDQAGRPSVPPSSLSLLGLVRHMAEVERNWFQRVMEDRDASPIYYTDENEELDMQPPADATLEAAVSTLRAEIAVADRVITAHTMDDLARRERRTDSGGTFFPNLRWILVHMIEEYARHCGHADLLREAVDGVVGD